MTWRRVRVFAILLLSSLRPFLNGAQGGRRVGFGFSPARQRPSSMTDDLSDWDIDHRPERRNVRGAPFSGRRWPACRSQSHAGSLYKPIVRNTAFTRGYSFDANCRRAALIGPVSLPFSERLGVSRSVVAEGRGLTARVTERVDEHEGIQKKTPLSARVDCDRTVIRQARNLEKHRAFRTHTE
jgi:hypothetical protein